MSLRIFIRVWVQEHLFSPDKLGRFPRMRVGWVGKLLFLQLHLLESRCKLNVYASKECLYISFLTFVPRLSDGTAWMEVNQWNQLALGKLPGQRALGLGALSEQTCPSWLTPSRRLLQREIVTGHQPEAPVSLTKGINGHCVFLNRWGKWHGKKAYALSRITNPRGRESKEKCDLQREHFPSWGRPELGLD